MEGEKEDATLVLPSSVSEEEESEVEPELWPPYLLGSYLGVRMVSGKGEEV